MSRKVLISLTLLSSLLVLAVAGVSEASKSDDPSLAKAALKVLDRNCLACHGATLQSGLDMRQR